MRIAANLSPQQFQLNALDALVRDLHVDANDAAITRVVIAMTHPQGLKVVAEGVETEAQRNFLARHRCDEIQGYPLSVSLPPDDFGKWLRRFLSAPYSFSLKTAVEARGRPVCVHTHWVKRPFFRFIRSRRPSGAGPIQFHPHLDFLKD